MNNKITVETKAGVYKDEKVYPYLSMVRVSAEAIAKEIEFAIGTIIDKEVGIRFIYLLEDMHKAKQQTDLTVKILRNVLELMQAKYCLELMNVLDFADEKKVNYFMNTFLDAMLIEIFAEDKEE